MEGVALMIVACRCAAKPHSCMRGEEIETMAPYRRIGAPLLILILALACSAPARGQSNTTQVYLPVLARPPIVTV